MKELIVQGNDRHLLLQDEISRSNNNPWPEVDHPKLVQDGAMIQQRKTQYFLGVFMVIWRNKKEYGLGSPKDTKLFIRLGGFRLGHRVSDRSRAFYFALCAFWIGWSICV